jgi:hypothetical protein
MGRIGHKGAAAPGNTHQQLQHYQDKVYGSAQCGYPQALPGVGYVCYLRSHISNLKVIKKAGSCKFAVTPKDVRSVNSLFEIFYIVSGTAQSTELVEVKKVNFQIADQFIFE